MEPWNLQFHICVLYELKHWQMVKFMISVCLFCSVLTYKEFLQTDGHWYKALVLSCNCNCLSSSGGKCYCVKLINT